MRIFCILHASCVPMQSLRGLLPSNRSSNQEQVIAHLSSKPRAPGMRPKALQPVPGLLIPVLPRVPWPSVPRSLNPRLVELAAGASHRAILRRRARLTPPRINSKARAQQPITRIGSVQVVTLCQSSNDVQAPFFDFPRHLSTIQQLECQPAGRIVLLQQRIQLFETPFVLSLVHQLNHAINEPIVSAHRQGFREFRRRALGGAVLVLFSGVHAGTLASTPGPRPALQNDEHSRALSPHPDSQRQSLLCFTPMSDLPSFIQALRDDPSLREALTQTSSTQPGDWASMPAAHLIQFAQHRGYQFTERDLTQAAHAQSQQLTESELEHVTGGSRQHDHIGNFNFKVEIDGISLALNGGINEIVMDDSPGSR